MYLVEDPLFFGHREKQLHFNKLKLIYHRATMQHFYHQMIQHRFKIHYISLDDFDTWTRPTDMISYYPADRLLQSRWPTLTYIDTPYFLLTSKQIDDYATLHGSKSHYSHREFYHYVKQTLNILPNIKSQDTLNRQPLPADYVPPALPSYNSELTEIVQEAIEYIGQRFPHNPGPKDPQQIVSALNCFPITWQESRRALRIFIRQRFALFGAYEDAMSTKSHAVHHSVLSTPINVGLLPPTIVLRQIMTATAPIQSREGFVRQLIGWREYSRMLYELAYDKIKQSNCFQHRRRLMSHWYRGTTGIDPLDVTIQKAFNTGYLHHIERLMIVANLMNLCEIHPDDVYRWFMEFACDSYDWVMVNNVYSMGLWADKGLTMRKPYISSPAYILRMSDFSEGRWTEQWKALYYTFLTNNREQIKGTPLIYNIGYWRKLPVSEQIRLTKLANRVRLKIGGKQ